MKSFYKYSVFMLLFAMLGMLTTTSLNSEPPFRAKERIDQLKKIKLLNILELDEDESNKFLAKYNELERVIEEKKLNSDHEINILELKISSNAPESEIKAQTKKTMEAQRQFHKSNEKKFAEIKTMLNTIEYAKFIIFEKRFKDEVRKIIMNNYRNKHKRQGQGQRQQMGE